MNAFHGFGVTLIALHDAPEEGANVRAGIEAAQRACPVDREGEGSARMRLAEACLQKAVALRDQMRQTRNRVRSNS
ncbi:MAG: hypothetical protein AB7O98_16125 [Hyphomonadaceae bacterium]